MINTKDVIRMKMPFPNISSNLAVSPHMYICIENATFTKRFIKCQSLKPYHLGKNKEPIQRVIEQPDLARNPFHKTTIIDCDKIFLLKEILITIDLLTNRRSDVCDDLFDEVSSKINNEQSSLHEIDTQPLLQLNYKMMPLN